MTLIGQKYSSTLAQYSHRPFALQSGPWILNQSWSNLLFAHWPVKAEILQKLLPPQLELDCFEGQAYIAVVPFEMREVSPRLTPSMPWLSFFPELNVRTYVKYNGQPGVYFFSLDAGNPLAVWIACNFYHLPYFNAAMKCEKQIIRAQHRSLSTTTESLDASRPQTTYKFKYTSSRKRSRLVPSVDLDVSYGPIGPVYQSSAGSLEHFLTERYCLFTVHNQTVFRGDIHHKPWPLQPAEATWRINTMTEPLAIKLSGEPILHFVENIDTVEWPIKPLISK